MRELRDREKTGDRRQKTELRELRELGGTGRQKMS